MGFHVVRLTGCQFRGVKGAKGRSRHELAQAPAQRAAWVAPFDRRLAKSATTKLAEALRTAFTEAEGASTAPEPCACAEA
ncbi:MAG: hypothetical protein R3A52_07150 [Polyangiales bacterium]